jgi:membrane protein insertase Oxa1/YidC/SpoIIIJ
MWQDLAALTPPLVVCVAFLVGVAMFLRHQMASKRRSDASKQDRSRDDQS